MRDFPGLSISPAGVRPIAERVSALMGMPMPPQPHARPNPDGWCRVPSQLPARLVLADPPITVVLWKVIEFDFTSAMEVIVCGIVAKLVTPRTLRRLHRCFWCRARTGAAGRLCATHRLQQSGYPRFLETLDFARVGGWQHCLAHQTTSRLATFGTQSFAICSDHKAPESISETGAHNARV